MGKALADISQTIATVKKCSICKKPLQKAANKQGPGKDPGKEPGKDSGKEPKITLSKFFPFCSYRCRMIDLGNWLGESYKISGDHAEVEEMINLEPVSAIAGQD